MDGFFRWYRARSMQLDLHKQIQFFDHHAVAIEHPALKKCVLLNVDGEQVLLDIEDVYRLVGMRLGVLNLEWWLSPDVDLTSQITSIPAGGEIRNYYFSGLTVAQRDAIGKMLVEYANSCANDTIGYILDRDGRTEEFDWDSVILYDCHTVTVLPDVLVLPRDIANKIGRRSIEIKSLNVDGNLVQVTSAK